MLIRILSCVLFMAAIAPGFQSDAWSQAVPAKEGSMLIPPPVSIESYPTEVGSEVRSNYLRAGVTVSAGYIDNLYAGSGNAVLGETTVSVRPKIAFDATSSRQQSTLLYSPGFTFYLPTSELNQTDQNAIFNWRFRVTPHGTISANDIFQQGSSSFSASSLGAAGSAPASAVGIIAPFAQRLTNAVDAQYSLQFNPRNMTGVTGRRFDLHYPDAAQVPGLYDSNEWGGGGFYSHRLTGAQYIGTTYRYSRILANPQNARSETQTHTFFLFYTIYLKRGLSFSLSGGPQEFDSEASFSATATPADGLRTLSHTRAVGSQQSADTQTQTVTTNSWSPGVTASTGWQRSHTNFSASYSRSVTAGGGLLGTFDSNSASASARWRASRTWTLAASATYSILKSVAPLPFFSTTLGGHSIGGVATADHPLSEHIGVSFEYDRLHQSYAGIAALVSNPNSDRGLVSVYWQFARPIGR
jgi:hypothetical protein